MLLVAECLLIQLICPIGLQNLSTIIFPFWSVFFQAKNSRDIEDQQLLF